MRYNKQKKIRCGVFLSSRQVHKVEIHGNLNRANISEKIKAGTLNETRRLIFDALEACGSNEHILREAEENLKKTY